MNFIFQLHVWDHSLCEEVVAEPSSSHKTGKIAYDVEREIKEDVSPPSVLLSSPGGGGVLHQFWPGSSSEYTSSGSTELNCGGDNILSSRRRHEDQQELLVEEHCVCYEVSAIHFFW